MTSRIAATLSILLPAAGLAAETNHPALAQTAVLSNAYIAASIAMDHPGLDALSVDSLGKERFPFVAMRPPPGSCRPAQATCRGSRVEYRGPGASGAAAPRWTIEVGKKELRLVSRWSAEDPPEPLVLDADNSICHVTLLGLMNPDG
jgi:hypothetical protein